MAKKSLPAGTIKRILESELKNINRQFQKEVGRIGIVNIILDIISKGIIAIEGFGARFQQYSEGYKRQIKGTKKSSSTTEGAYSPLSFGKNGKSRKSKKVKSSLAVTYGKRVSPVNLKLTGEMHDSLSYNPSTGELKADHERWVFHNEGMGNLPVRRLLPNKEGERFNRRIQNRITEALAKAIGVETKKAKRFLGVKFNIK